MQTLRALALLPLLLASCAPQRAAVPADTPPASAQPAAAPPVQQERRALLWEVTREGAPEHPLYLTGSIHVGQADQFVFPPSVEAAFARSDALVLEVDPERVDPVQVQELVMRLGLSLPPSAGLSASISPETKALLPDALARVGLSLQSVEVMRPWFLASMVSVMELQKAGYSEKGGIDALFLARARGHKQVLELETVEGQLQLLADLPAQVQDLMLLDAIRTAPLMAVQLASVAAAWHGGNPEAIADQLLAVRKDPRYAPMHEAFVTARNRAMAEKIAAQLESPQIHFVVVGAGHVVGPDGIPALLAQKGFTCRQMPSAAP